MHEHHEHRHHERGDEEWGEDWGRGRGRARARWGPGGPGRRGGPFGPPGFGPMAFGFGPWPGEGKGRRGPRVRRGDVRAAALALLAEEPRNGYQLIQEIAERSDGVWQPSPGSMYPALQQLEDEGLIQAETPEGGRKRYALTDEVRAPWDDVASSVGTDAIELRRLIAAVAAAAVQVTQVGTAAQVTQAQQILTDTRRKLYAILAADDDASEE